MQFPERRSVARGSEGGHAWAWEMQDLKLSFGVGPVHAESMFPTFNRQRRTEHLSVAPPFRYFVHPDLLWPLHDTKQLNRSCGTQVETASVSEYLKQVHDMTLLASVQQAQRDSIAAFEDFMDQCMEASLLALLGRAAGAAEERQTRRGGGRDDLGRSIPAPLLLLSLCRPTGGQTSAICSSQSSQLGCPLPTIPQMQEGSGPLEVP